jgi:hypothetical protein
MTYSLSLKMEATCSSEMSVDFQWPAWHYISDDKTLHNHWCENVKSYTALEVLTEVTIQSTVFRDVMLFSLVEFHHFGETNCLHLKHHRANQASNQQEVDGKQSFTSLHGVTSERTVLFCLKMFAKTAEYNLTVSVFRVTNDLVTFN